MRKLLMSSVVFLAFILCSCTNTLPEKPGTEKPSTEEPTGKEAMSIEFMGENITAPTSYPDVPDAYTPVLDDLYLYGELVYRYETINREGKVTQEILDEYEEIEEEIQQRGYIAYPEGGTEGTSGYALADLDGDSSPELLLLDNNSSKLLYKHTPAIYSVFKIRNGHLVCVEKDSTELAYNTILAADGTFYRCSDGDTYLSSFRLQPDSYVFTILSEVRSKLSFSEGDVPVPYWVKKENGNEVNINKEEYDEIFEQYNNIKELMKLDFVPLHPDATNAYSPSPTEESKKTSMEYPQSYQGAPTEYKPILDDLYYLSESLYREESIDDARGETGIGEIPEGELGYAVADLNNDGTPELFLGSLGGLNKSAPNSVFTLKSANPVLLQSFWSRSTGVISVDGTIYCSGSGGAAVTYLSSYRLDENADSFTQLTDMYSGYSDSEGKPYFVQVVEGKKCYITEKEFNDFREKYENPSETMKLTFIPIAN